MASGIQTASRADRLKAYAVLTAGVAPASALAGVIGRNDVNISLDFQSPQADLDFGGQFGRVFNFLLTGDSNQFQNTYYNSFPGSDGYGNPVINRSTIRQRSQFVNRQAGVQFNAGGRWTRASFAGYAGFGGIRPLNAGFRIDNNLGQTAYGSQVAWNNVSPANFINFRDSTNYRQVRTAFGFGYTNRFYNFTYYGPWRYPAGNRAFLGIRFSDNGVDFYNGWIDVGVDFTAAGLTIYGWGLNTDVNGSIEAGQIPAPAAGGLALLALGAAGIRRTRAARRAA